MKRLYRTYGFAWRALFAVGLAGVAVIGWVLPGMSQAVLMSLLLGWGVAILGGFALLRWRMSQHA